MIITTIVISIILLYYIIKKILNSDCSFSRSAEFHPFWKENAEKIVKESISVMEDTVKQFAVISERFQGIYYHAIAFSDIKGAEGYSVLMSLAPLVLWLLSLIFAVMVLCFSGIYIGFRVLSKQCKSRI